MVLAIELCHQAGILVEEIGNAEEVSSGAEHGLVDQRPR
jgi:hypothetical protein